MSDELIWVVGGKNSNANASFLWTDNIPNITDADIIIIDLSTFPAKPANYKEPLFLRSEPYRSPPSWVKPHVANWHAEITNNLVDRMTSGGHVIFLLDSNPVSRFMLSKGLIPFGIKIANTPTRNIHYGRENKFAGYLQYVQQADYGLSISNLVTDLYANSDVKLLFPHDQITDKSKRLIGASYNVNGGRGSSGSITLLPPTTTGTHEQALDALIAVFKNNIAESPPPWAETAFVPGIENLELKLDTLARQTNDIAAQISNLESEKNDLVEWRKLLYSNAKQLEASVKAAFITLGFSEIDDGRGDDKEDLTIELTSIPEIGVIEVKGREGHVQMSDIDQCIRWAEDYKSDDSSHTTKGILVLINCV